MHRPCEPGGVVKGPIAAVRDGDKISIDIPKRELQLFVTENEMQRRLAEVKPVEKELKGMLLKYRKLVGQANEGAVCR